MGTLPDLSPYTDIRREFFADAYSRALPLNDFVALGKPSHTHKWQAFDEAAAQCTVDGVRLASFIRRMPVLVLAATWCGDCARHSALFKLISQHTAQLQFRWADNKLFPELQNELRANGAEKIPTIVVFSEDFFEIARIGDAPLSTYRRKAHAQLGGTCDPGIVMPPTEELQEELNEWCDIFERAQLILRLSPLLRRRYDD